MDENDLPGVLERKGLTFFFFFFFFFFLERLFARIRQPNRMSGRMLIFPASAGRRTLERAKGGSMAGSMAVAIADDAVLDIGNSWRILA